MTLACGAPRAVSSRARPAASGSRASSVKKSARVWQMVSPIAGSILSSPVPIVKSPVIVPSVSRIRMFEQLVARAAGSKWSHKRAASAMNFGSSPIPSQRPSRMKRSASVSLRCRGSAFVKPNFARSSAPQGAAGDLE